MGQSPHPLKHGKGDIITAKLIDQKDVWWITVVYAGVEGRDNQDTNRQLYEALLEIEGRVGKDKWVIMGDLNGHIGLLNERVNINGQMILDFTEKNWEYNKKLGAGKPCNMEG